MAGFKAFSMKWIAAGVAVVTIGLGTASAQSKPVRSTPNGQPLGQFAPSKPFPWKPAPQPQPQVIIQQKPTTGLDVAIAGINAFTTLASQAKPQPQPYPYPLHPHYPQYQPYPQQYPQTNPFATGQPNPYGGQKPYGYVPRNRTSRP